MKHYILLAIALTLFSCQEKPLSWQLEKEIDLDDITPIGLTQLGDHIWIADGDNNRLAHLDLDGKLISTYDGFERPMHLSSDGKDLYVPEYGKDQITIFSPQGKSVVSMTDSLDAPAGVDKQGEQIAIADFYNHSILYSKDGTTWSRYGKKGKASGEFHYPTDIQLVGEKIYVADAYNNRVQVLSTSGDHLATIGAAEKMNAATGIYVSETQLFVTDFENDRVLIYTLDGTLDQTIDSNLSKPTDIMVIGEHLYIANYGGKNLRRYALSNKPVSKLGKEYTSAYVCPMHCVGSGSDAMGTCPVCKMDYVVNEDK